MSVRKVYTPTGNLHVAPDDLICMQAYTVRLVATDVTHGTVL